MIDCLVSKLYRSHVYFFASCNYRFEFRLRPNSRDLIPWWSEQRIIINPNSTVKNYWHVLALATIRSAYKSVSNKDEDRSAIFFWTGREIAKFGKNRLSRAVRCNVLHLIFTVPAGSPSRGGGVLVYVKGINQPSLPTPFYSVLVSVSVFMALSPVFDSINSPDNIICFLTLFFRS